MDCQMTTHSDYDSDLEELNATLRKPRRVIANEMKLKISKTKDIKKTQRESRTSTTKRDSIVSAKRRNARQEIFCLCQKKYDNSPMI